jgi:hypothetical protein
MRGRHRTARTRSPWRLPQRVVPAAVAPALALITTPGTASATGNGTGTAVGLPGGGLVGTWFIRRTVRSRARQVSPAA